MIEQLMKIVFSLVATSEMSAFLTAPGGGGGGGEYFPPNHCFWLYIFAIH